MFLSLPGQRGQRGKMALRIRHPRLLILALAFALPLSPGASISGQCSSYTSCQACYDPSSSPLPSSPTDSCRWCAGKCYDPDDVQCALGETCAPPPPTAGSCSQIASCDQCAVQSGCNWCGDGKCHAYYSVYGCIGALSCDEAPTGSCTRPARYDLGGESGAGERGSVCAGRSASYQTVGVRISDGHWSLPEGCGSRGRS